MLRLENIKKDYITGDSKVQALKGVSLNFRKNEFVSILGQSGCGKTTLLNIIGGLDRYTLGDLVINGKSTKEFKDKDWDAYRNHSVGFVFQSYNLIPHQTILANVELALTLSGVSKKERRKKAIKALEDENTVAKQTIPAPAQFLAQFIMPFNRENTEKYYSSDEELINDIGAGYKKVIDDLYNAGCRNLQFDDCTWGMMADKTGHLAYGTTPEGLKEIQKIHKDINNKVIANAPKDMVISMHVCRGNFHSTYANSGAYDPVADVLFGNQNVDAFYLEFDDERSGGFAPLAKVSGDKKVVLGLITTKSPVLENKEEIIARINEAKKYIPLDRLCLSPQCGFASCEIGNKLTEKQQWAKLELVKEIADEIWK